MDISDRIQALRKSKGISQEELADKVGVSRQAVSKWESEQSIPEIDKIISMSEYFEVTTDFLLKGIEPIKDASQKQKQIGSKVLYLLATAFVITGLFAVLGSWIENQSFSSIFGGFIIQLMGLVLYGIGNYLSKEKAPLYLNWIIVMGLLFMPISMISGSVSLLLFKRGELAPFPVEGLQIIIFLIVYLLIAGFNYVILHRYSKK